MTHCAKEGGPSPAIVHQLILRGARSGTVRLGGTALHWVVYYNAYECLNIFLQSMTCEDLAVRDVDGRTPLHLAVLGNAFQCVVALLRSMRPSDIEIRGTIDSMTAKQLAGQCRETHSRILETFFAYEASFAMLAHNYDQINFMQQGLKYLPSGRGRGSRKGKKRGPYKKRKHSASKSAENVGAQQTSFGDVSTMFNVKRRTMNWSKDPDLFPILKAAVDELLAMGSSPKTRQVSQKYGISLRTLRRYAAAERRRRYEIAHPQKLQKDNEKFLGDMVAAVIEPKRTSAVPATQVKMVTPASTTASASAPGTTTCIEVLEVTAPQPLHEHELAESSGKVMTKPGTPDIDARIASVEDNDAERE